MNGLVRDFAIVPPLDHGPPPSAAEAYDENGVDRTMIRSALRRTPTECLDTLDELLQLAETARSVPEPLR